MEQPRAELLSQIQSTLFKHIPHPYLVFDSSFTIHAARLDNSFFFQSVTVEEDACVPDLVTPFWMDYLLKMLPVNHVRSTSGVQSIKVDGENLYGELDLMAIEQSDNFLLLFKDLTSTYKTAAQLELKFKHLVENGTDAVAILDAKGVPAYVSPNIPRVLGYTEDEALQLNLFDIVHPEDRDEVGKVWMEMLENPGVPIAGRVSRILHKDGRWRWMEATVINMLHDPLVNGVVDNFRDITDAKLATEQRELERIDKAAMINATPDLMWSVNRDLHLVAANDKFLNRASQFIGYELRTGSVVLGNETIEPAISSYWLKLYNRALSGESVEEEFFNPARNGAGGTWMMLSMNPIYSAGEIIGVAGFASDVTRRKNQQDELRTTNERLAEAQKIANLGYWEVNLQTGDIYWSEEMRKLWELDANVPITMEFFYSSLHPDDRDRFIEVNETCLREGRDLDDEHRILLPNGTIKYLHERATLLRAEDGQPIVFRGTTQDITDAKKILESIRLSNERFELVNKATSDAVWDMDLVSGKVFWGDGFFTLFGYPVNEQATDPASWEDRLHPQDREKILASVAELVLDPKGTTWQTEYRYLKANGDYAYVSDTALVIRNENGTAIRMIGAMKDITQAKEAEQRITQERTRMRTIIDNIPDYVFVKDIEGRHVVCNKAQVALLGAMSEEEVIGKTVEDFLGDFRSFGYKEGDKLVFKTGQTIFNKEEILYMPDGSLRHALTTKVPLKNELGVVIGLVGISRDVTDRYRKQQDDKLLADITEHILNSADMNETLEQLIKWLCIHFQADIGEAWIQYPGQQKLQRTACWAPEKWSQHVYHQSAETYNLNEHPVAAYWNAATPGFTTWNLDPPLESSLVIPLSVQGQSTALLQFYFREEKKMSDELLEFCIRLGKKLGLDMKTRRNEVELSLFFSHCPDPLCIASSNGFFSKVNPAFLQLFGFSEEYVLSNPILSFLHPEDLSYAMSVLEHAFAGEKVDSYECRMKTAEGQWKWLTWSTSEQYYENGVVFAYGKDITLLKETERDMAQFKKVLDSSRDGIAIYHPTTKQNYMNAAMQEMLGYTPDEIGSMPSPSITYVDEQQGHDMFDTIIGGGYFKGDVQIKSKNGTTVDYHLSAGPIFDEYGNVEAVYGIHMDISERKQYLAAILESKERYDLVAKATNDAVWDWNIETGEVVRPGNGLETLFGYKSEEAFADNQFWKNRVHPDDIHRVESDRAQILIAPSISYWEDEYRFQKADGEMAYVHDKGYIIRNEQGVAIRMIGATQDITHRVRYLNETIRVKQNLDALINNTSDMVWSYDLDKKLIHANINFQQEFHLLCGEWPVEGAPVLNSAMPAEVISDWLPLYNRSLTGETFSTELVYTAASGTDETHLLVSFAPIRNAEGQLLGAACYAKNITEIKKASKKLEELNQALLINAEELAASNADLERFAFIASHDLQEPLRMVSSFLQLLKQRYGGQLDQKADSYIEFAVDGANRMKALIHSLLNYARIGNPAIDAVAVDLNMVMRDVQILLKTKIQETNALVLSDQLPVISKANYTQLLQLMQNLLSNALKYRGDEDPLIQVGVLNGDGFWTIFVRDNGIGLDMRYAEKIFMVFQRLHHQRTYSGTGIGLSICKRIVEKMGGKIWVESSVGKGSCFYFTILK